MQFKKLWTKPALKRLAAAVQLRPWPPSFPRTHSITQFPQSPYCPRDMAALMWRLTD
jgi:hypothetical protein